MAAQPNPVSTVDKFATQAVESYYRWLDGTQEQRGELLGRYLQSPGAGALMDWNGHTLATVEAITGYFATLPRTKHSPKCIDALPLPGCVGADTFVVTVTGTASYGDERHLRHYHHRIIFCNADKLRIVHDYFRWTGEGDAR